MQCIYSILSMQCLNNKVYPRNCIRNYYKDMASPRLGQLHPLT